jgi:hypothetical protein
MFYIFMVRRKARLAASKSPSSLKRSKRKSRRTNALIRGKDSVRFDGKHRKSTKKLPKTTSTFRKSAQNTKIKSKKTDRTNMSKVSASNNRRRNPRRETPLYVQRTSGRQEKFDSRRMTQTVSRSGVPFLMARDITKKVIRNIGRRKKSTGTGKSSNSPRRLNLEKDKMVKKDLVIPGSEIRSMITEELRNRNRAYIAASYDGQTPSSTGMDTGENTDSTAPSLGNITAQKTNIIHDKSKYGGV